MEAQCPRCEHLLARDASAGLPVDACPECGGIWFDGGELTRLAQSRPGLLAGLEHRHEPRRAGTPAPPQLGGCLCPVCRVFMQEFEFPWAPGIRLDGCPRCRGIWADDGELTRIEAFIHRQRRQSAARVPSGREHRAAAAAELSVASIPPPPPDPAPRTKPKDWQKRLLHRIRAAEELFSRFQER